MIAALRLLGLLLLIALTFLLPKFVSEGGLRRIPGVGAEGGSAPPLATTAVSADSGEDAASWDTSGLPKPPVEVAPTAVTRKLLPYDRFLRFDVTPQWVASNFSRVTVLPTARGEALRVALITGTRHNDLAGSLTYYFDHQEVVQRIAVEGLTGDPAELVAFVTEKYRLSRVAPDVYTRQFHRVVLAGLIVERAPVVREAESPTKRRVVLELNRPESYARISNDFHHRLYEAAGS